MFFRPPASALMDGYGRLSVQTGAPMDDDDSSDDGGCAVFSDEESGSDGGLSWLLDFLLGEYFSYSESLDEGHSLSAGRFLLEPGVDAYGRGLNERLLHVLEKCLRMGLAWQPWERLGVDEEALFRMFPYLRLFAAEPDEPYVDPELEAYLSGVDYGSEYRASDSTYRLYLLIRALWMDAFMPANQALEAWGNVILHYAEDATLANAISDVMHRPWLESSWLVLSRNIQSVRDDLVLHSIVRLIYAKFRSSSQRFQFSSVMPYLLILPGLSDEERRGVITYFEILIRESVEHNPVRADRVFETTLECLRQSFEIEEAQHALVLLNELSDRDFIREDLRASLFLLEAFSRLFKDDALELKLLNRVAHLILEESEDQQDRVDYALRKLSEIFVGGTLGERGKTFFLELLASFSNSCMDCLPSVVHALGVLLSDSSLGEDLFVKLWKQYLSYFKNDSPEMALSISRTLRLVSHSPYLTPAKRRRCLNYILEDDLFDGALIIDVILEAEEHDEIWRQGLERLLWGIIHQPSSDFWDHVKEKLPALLSSDFFRAGRFNGYYERILEALLKLVDLTCDADSQELMDFRGEVLEILVMHWVSDTRSLDEALGLLKGQGLCNGVPQQVTKLWFWLFQNRLLDSSRLEDSVKWLLNQGSSNANRCLAVALCDTSMDIDLRVEVLERIYRSVDLKTLVTLLLKGTSWVQQAKLLYGIAHGISHCNDEGTLYQIELKLIRSGYLEHQIRRALFARHFDAVAERYLRAARSVLRVLSRINLFEEYLLPYERFCSKVIDDGTSELLLCDSAQVWLDRLSSLKEGKPFPANDVLDK